nr:MAG TPA: hypothetical protein [Caudoviricetes sp.]
MLKTGSYPPDYLMDESLHSLLNACGLLRNW